MPIYANLDSYSQEEMDFWDRLCLCAGKRYKTFRGLEYTFAVKGNELFFSRKRKSITRATIMQAYRKTKERLAKDMPISGPKKLDVFGASYLYPIFKDLGLFE